MGTIKGRQRLARQPNKGNTTMTTIDVRAIWEDFGIYAFMLCAFGVIGGAAVAGFGAVQIGGPVMLYSFGGLMVTMLGLLVADSGE
jgi:hypothetical protein